MPKSLDPIEILIRRLQRSAGLEQSELAELRTLQVDVADVARNEAISREGDRVEHCMLLVEGFLIRLQHTRGGKRQILSFYVPGDIPDLQTLHLPTMDHSLAAITPARLGRIPHKSIQELCNRNRRVADALWRETLIDAAVARTWVRCVGGLTARARVAHMLCELHARLDAVGLAKDPIRMPITQADFADAMSLSVVQINMTLRDLREEGLITVHKREMIVHDLVRLQYVAEFDPLYLHLDPAQRR